MPTKGEGAVAALDFPDDQRRDLAKKSRDWVCKVCGSANATALPEEGSLSEC